MGVYLNNGATSWPKAPGVGQAISDFLTNSGANLARGAASSRDLAIMNQVLDCRIALDRLFEASGNPCLVTFTQNVSESLNLVFNGFLRSGDHVVTTTMEHNSVARPLMLLQRERNLKVTRLQGDAQGFVDPAQLDDLLNQKIRLVVLSGGNNVCGTIQDLQGWSDRCHRAGVALVVDAAQIAGHIPFSLKQTPVSAFCWTGHKGLLGPQGIGGVIWNEDFYRQVRPLVCGGTGSLSDQMDQPTQMPDKFETGTPNLPGIVGLHAALTYVEQQTVQSLYQRTHKMGQLLLEQLLEIPDLILYGFPIMNRRLPVFAFNIKGYDNSDLASKLAQRGVESRPGLHCSPWSHQTLGTFPTGALRWSLGPFTTEEDVDCAIQMLKSCL